MYLQPPFQRLFWRFFEQTLDLSEVKCYLYPVKRLASGATQMKQTLLYKKKTDRTSLPIEDLGRFLLNQPNFNPSMGLSFHGGVRATTHRWSKRVIEQSGRFGQQGSPITKKWLVRPFKCSICICGTNECNNRPSE